MKKIAAKTKRLLAYAGIIGACALLALTFFTISQYEKAKYKSIVKDVHKRAVEIGIAQTKTITSKNTNRIIKKLYRSLVTL